MRIKLSAISKILSCFFTFLLLLQFFYFVPKPQEAKADGESWYNSNWLYRKPITIDNTSGTSTLTNYQVQVSVTYDSKMQSDFDDIRFTDSDSTTLLDHWLETSTTSVSAIFKVEVPRVPASSTKTIYMYYGNSGASNASNGDNTFTRNSYAWQKYANNPVLDLGSSGTWDDLDVHEVDVIKEGDIYYMWYAGYKTNWAIGLATSSDGITWTKDPGNPVFTKGSGGKFDESHVTGPHIIKEGNTYYMWYSGINNTGIRAIGLASSTDKKTWTRLNDGNAVLSGTPAQWDSSGTGTPYVFKIGDTYYMFYGNSTTKGIGYATSTDKINWTKYGGNPVLSNSVGYAWDYNLVLEPAVVKIGDLYYMFYEGSNGHSRIGYAISTDLNTWTKVGNNNPIMPLGAVGSWESIHHSAVYILLDSDTLSPLTVNGKYMMWYSGENPRARIGLATLSSSDNTFTEGIFENWETGTVPAEWVDMNNKGSESIVSSPVYNGSYALRELINGQGSYDGRKKSSFRIYEGKLELWWYFSTLASGGAWSEIRTKWDDGYYITYRPLSGTNAVGYNFYTSENCYHIYLGVPTIDTWAAFSRDIQADKEAAWVASGRFLSYITQIELIVLDGGGISLQNTKFDLVRSRKFSSPEPSTSLGTEEGYFIAVPTIGTPTVLSSTAIRWNFTDNADNETGFRVYTNADAIASATANLTYLDETGLSENTQYTRYVKAYNSYGESASSSATSTYTLINVPSSLSFDTVGTSSITMSASGTLPNLASSTSGVYFNETSGNSGGSDSSWQQTASYQDTGLSENTQYTYRVKARNGDGTTTSYTSTSSKYTLASTPTGFNFMRHPSSLDIYVDSFPNDHLGSSGYLFWRTDNSSYNSGWIQTNDWQDPNMVEGTTYTYAVKYRNGNGIETATTTMGGVSFVRDNGGGGTPTIPQQTTSTSSVQATTTLSNTTSTIQATSTVSFEKPISQMSQDEIIAKIAQITQAIAQLQSLLTNSLSNIPNTFSFKDTLKQGITDIAVKYLQVILNQDLDTQVAQTGVGSKGKETNYFGQKTKQAVIKFQEKYKDTILTPWSLTKGTGIIGKTTRDKLNSLLSK
jgi:predicted GH43/DUF377 family glycosyl hydrolase